MRLVFGLLGACALLAGDALACQQERHIYRSLVKREVTAPTPLTDDESTLVGSVSNTTIADWSYYYTHGQHLAGQNKTMAQWTADRWTENGIESSLVAYDVFLNYPVSKSLSLSHANGSVFQPALEEAVLLADETTGYPNSVPTFHGYCTGLLLHRHVRGAC